MRAGALERIVAIYWKPVYKYVRIRWRKDDEDARDLTQEFFARLIEHDILSGYDPAQARLRTYLRSCIDHMVANLDRAARTVKRGGGARFHSLDFETAERELSLAGIPAQEDVEKFFEREWVRHLFSMAIECLRKECEASGKSVHFAIFEKYDLEEAAAAKPSYQDLAREFGLSVSDVTNRLAFARRQFRRATLDILRETTASDEEFQREARSLLGIQPV